MSTVPMLFLALVIALLLNAQVRHATAYRVAYFIPNVTSMVAMAVVFGSVFAQAGLGNSLLKVIGVDGVDWLMPSLGIKSAISLMIIWRRAGYNALIFLDPGTTGDPGQEGLTIVLHLWQKAFNDHQFGYGAAIEWSLFALIALFAIINWRLVSGSGRDDRSRISWRQGARNGR